MAGYECYTPNMPDDFLKCRGIVAAWGLGGESFYFPDSAGYPLGEEHGGATYYMFEVREREKEKEKESERYREREREGERAWGHGAASPSASLTRRATTYQFSFTF